ncbi:hypothetical protein J1614_011305 [Plenodomus biglobosus]|nr:hypothetical protein J1614_011305 [Plenodomus biglobosus]
MSICSHTLRAWSRSHVPTSKTLLPFLYQTATIQQCASTTRHGTRRTFQSRSDGGEDIPFEDGTLPPPAEPELDRPTTITDNERKAFRKLYQTATRQEQERSDKKHEIQRDEIADEYYEEDEDTTGSLDKVFDDVLKGKPALQARAGTARPPPSRTKKPSKHVQPTAKDTGEVQSTAATTAAALNLKQLRTAEMDRFTTLLSTAKTDHELWHMLETEVFTPVRQLDLDGTSKTKSQREASARLNATHSKLKIKSASTKFEAELTQQRVLFQNFPHYLIHAITTLRDSFPKSSLPLSILPAIKSLGRSSYALGATTTLYKHLLRTAWLHQSSYHAIDALLTDMNNSAVEFDTDILALLDSIIKEHNMALSGALGREMLMVNGLLLFRDGLAKIKMWRQVVAARVGPVAPSRPQPLGTLEMRGKYAGPRKVQVNTPGGGLNGPVRRRDGPGGSEWRKVDLTSGA